MSYLFPIKVYQDEIENVFCSLELGGGSCNFLQTQTQITQMTLLKISHVNLFLSCFLFLQSL